MLLLICCVIVVSMAAGAESAEEAGEPGGLPRRPVHDEERRGAVHLVDEVALAYRPFGRRAAAVELDPFHGHSPVGCSRHHLA